MSNTDDSKERERYFQELAEQEELREREEYQKFLHEVYENFDYYWQTELSKERPEGDEDTEEFARRIAEMAYLKGLEDNENI